MELEISAALRREAIGWHVRLRDGDAAAWDQFVVWLEADPAHRAAYDLIEAADAEVVPLIAVPRPAVMRPAVRVSRGWLAWGSVAAAAVAAVGVWTLQLPSERYEIVTGPGEQRVVALDGATQVTLNGATRLMLDRGNPRYASLVRGEALFRVRHDPAAPFTVDIGDDRVVDVGTVFNVVRRADETRVAVAEGEVIYNPGREALRLRPGQALVDPAGAARIVVTSVDARMIGTWRQGRLSYVAEPLARIAADLERSLGTRIAVAPGLAARRFSGTIVVDRSGPGQLARLGPVLDVEVRASGDTWTLQPLAETVR